MNDKNISVEPLAIGIDIGGTGTKFGVVDSMGNVLFSSEITTRGYDDINDYIAKLSEVISKTIERSGGVGRFRGIGVGVPNGNFYSGTIEYAPNLPWKGIIPLAKLLESAFKLPVVLTNDANAAAIGEMKYGAAKNMKDFIMVTLGTGVGSGIVANGKLIYGHDGFAGELGHIIIIPDGRMHEGTGIKGCLESYASATGVAKSAVEFLQNSSKPSLLRKYDISKITSKEVYEAAIEGDEIALEIFEFTGKILGIALANAVMITSPEAIIFFGGLAKAGSLILDPAKKYMELNVIEIFKNKVSFFISHLKESDAAILGASALVWDL